MRVGFMVAAAVAAAGMSAPAVAAPLVTGRYDFTAAFSGGPITTIAGFMVVSYDPTISSAPTLSAFGITVPSQYLPAAVYHTQYGGFTIGDNCFGANACSANAGQNQFYISFGVNDAGAVIYQGGAFYSATNLPQYASTSQTVTFQPSATVPVPEPATWAMMLAGFAAAGASLRRRRLITVGVQVG